VEDNINRCNSALDHLETAARIISNIRGSMSDTTKPKTRPNQDTRACLNELGRQLGVLGNIYIKTRPELYARCFHAVNLIIELSNVLDELNI